MSDVDPSSSPKAVFLSYTSDDVAVALAVCEALRESGIEVWMDRSELQGGDAWDANIQRQIRECALIIPIISKRTQARREGYFRLEWRLADERMRLVADGTPLILPVAADETREQEALVPKSFLTVQWSRLPHGHVPPAFVARVRKLLGLESAVVSKTVPAIGIPPIPKNDSLAAFDAPATVEPMSEAGGESGSSRRSLWPFAATAILALLVGGIAIWFLKPAPEPSQVASKPLVRFAHELPASGSFTAIAAGLVAISPDGRSFAYSTSSGLFIRKMDEIEARVIPGTERSYAMSLVYSPDGQSLAFYAGKELRKVSVGGGELVAIAPAEIPSGMSWGRDGSILFSQADGIWRINSAGTAREKIIPAGEGERFVDPQLLPDGKSVLFSSRQNSGLLQVEVSTLADKKRKVVVSGGVSGRYLPYTGHLLYSVGDDIFGIAFDAQRGVTHGTAVPLLQGVGGFRNNTSHLAVADDGTLLYLGSSSADITIPVWVDRQGREEPLKIDPDVYMSFALSADDTKVSLGVAENKGFGLVVWDFAGETRTRLTLGLTGGVIPIWSLDGSQILYDSLDGKISAKPVNNTRAPEIVVTEIGSRARRLYPSFITPDGRSLVFDTDFDIGMISFDGKGPVTWLFKSPQFREAGAALSPDGKWIAYHSNESGRDEVYVSPFPGVDQDRVLISNAGGNRPLWSPDGKELFYIGGLTSDTQRFMSATVSSEGGKFAVAARNPVWSGTLKSLRYTIPVNRLRPIGIGRDNQRFLVLKEAAEDATERIHIVQNWTEELKRRVPGFLP